MPEEIIKIKLDADQFQTEIAARNKQIEQVKADIRELTAAIKENGTATDAQVKEQIKLESTLRNLNKEQNTAKRVLDNHTKSTKDAKGSIQSLRSDLSVLTDQWSRLSQEERENSEVGKNLTKQIKATSDKLKEQEGTIGNNTRNVGGYTEAIDRAISGNAQFSETFQQIKEGYEIIKSAGGQFLESLRSTKTATEAQTGATVASTGAMGAAKQASIGLGISLKAMGIGLIIAAVAGLVAYFSKFEEGVESLERGISFLSGAFDEIIGRIGNFGKQLVEAFLNPIEIVKGLGNFIKLAFTSPQQAIEQLKTSVNNMTVDFTEFTGSVIKAGLATAELTRRTQELEDAQNAALINQEKLKGQIDQLILQARERGKSEKDRVEGLKQAGVLEQQLTADRLKFAKEELSIAIERDKIAKANGELAEEMSKARIDAEVKVIAIENESAMQRQQIANRESGLMQEINKEREERAKKHEESITKNAKAAIELRVLQAGEGSRKELEERLKLINFNRDAALKAEGVTENEKLLIREQAEKDRLNLTYEYTQKWLAIEKKRVDDFKALTDKEFSESNQNTDAYYKNLQAAAANAYAEGKTTREQYNAELRSIETESLNALLQNARDYGQSTSELEIELANRRIEIKQQEFDKEQRIQEARYNAYSVAANALMSLNEILAGKNAEATDFAKAITLIQIGIDTAKAISALTASAATVSAAIAASSGPAGIVTGPAAYAIYYGTQIASILANIAEAKNLLMEDTPKPKFALGTVLEGPVHTAGGIQIYGKSGAYFGEAEGGEPILTANVSKNPVLLSMASAINQLAGGRALAPSFYNAEGGTLPAATRRYLGGPGGLSIDYSKIAEAVSKQRIFAEITDVRTGLETLEMRQKKVNH